MKVWLTWYSRVAVLLKERKLRDELVGVYASYDDAMTGADRDYRKHAGLVLDVRMPSDYWVEEVKVESFA